MSLLGAQLVFDRAVRFRGNMLEWQGKYLERERERESLQTHTAKNQLSRRLTRSCRAESSWKSVFGWFWLPGDASALDPKAAKARPSSSTRSRVGKSQAGRRGVRQHIVQKEARKPPEDVHGTEENTEKIIGNHRRTQTSVQTSCRTKRRGGNKATAREQRIKEIINSCRDEETLRNQENVSKNKVNFGWEERKKNLGGRESGLKPFEVQSWHLCEQSRLLVRKRC